MYIYIYVTPYLAQPGTPADCGQRPLPFLKERHLKAHEANMPQFTPRANAKNIKTFVMNFTCGVFSNGTLTQRAHCPNSRARLWAATCCALAI